MLNKHKFKGLKCNIKKSFFGYTEMGHLGFWVTRNGVKTINRKIEEKEHMKPPTYQKEVRQFISVVNYYYNMWSGRSYTLAPTQNNVQ